MITMDDNALMMIYNNKIIVEMIKLMIMIIIRTIVFWKSGKKQRYEKGDFPYMEAKFHFTGTFFSFLARTSWCLLETASSYIILRLFVRAVVTILYSICFTLSTYALQSRGQAMVDIGATSGPKSMAAPLLQDIMQSWLDNCPSICSTS